MVYCKKLHNLNEFNKKRLSFLANTFEVSYSIKKYSREYGYV